MTEKDLRIGNLIEFLGEVREVESIDNLPKRPDMYWVKTKGMIPHKVFHFKGIPLTEEWLVKFGFKKVLNFYTIGCGSNTMSIYCFKDFSRVQIVAQTVCRINYVHQLQNLFFALTGEELKLKECKSEAHE